MINNTAPEDLTSPFLGVFQDAERQRLQSEDASRRAIVGAVVGPVTDVDVGSVDPQHPQYNGGRNG